MTDIAIRLWQEVKNHAAARDEIDEIFYATSVTKTFDSENHRAAFNERWLGRYIKNHAAWFYVAQTGDNTTSPSHVAGYLAGCIDDPRNGHQFDDIEYFKTFADHLDLYTAHLHINLAPQFRNAGLGARLVARFLKDAKRAGMPGAHVVTGANSLNVAFYTRCGFKTIATAPTTPEAATENVFLGIRL